MPAAAEKDYFTAGAIACHITPHSPRVRTGYAWRPMNPMSAQRAPGPYKRRTVSRHEGAVIWLTGLSGSGKTTIATLVERELVERDVDAVRLDGDDLRKTISPDLGFSDRDRHLNVQRAAALSALLARAGFLVISSLISPHRAGREYARSLVKAGHFIEVFVDCPLATCERRDPKGLYRRARAGLLSEFTGLASRYEAPASAEVRLDSSTASANECAATILTYIYQAGLITSSRDNSVAVDLP